MAVKTIFYGIGAQKAATSWLFAELGRCAEVHLPLPKELHYWDVIRAPTMSVFRARAHLRKEQDAAGVGRNLLRRRFTAEGREKSRRLAAHARLLESDGTDHGVYLDYLTRDAGAARLAGDITPGYALLSRATFAEMAALHPDTRFFFIMRDPVERLASGIKQSLSGAIGAAKDPARQAAILSRAFAEAIRNPRDPARHRSDYDWTITELEAAVPRERILYLFYETLFAPEAAGRLGDFLGLDGFQPDISRRVNPSVTDALGVPPDLEAEARAALAPVYDFVRDRFANEVPGRWR